MFREKREIEGSRDGGYPLSVDTVFIYCVPSSQDGPLNRLCMNE